MNYAGVIYPLLCITVFVWRDMNDSDNFHASMKHYEMRASTLKTGEISVDAVITDTGLWTNHMSLPT